VLALEVARLAGGVDRLVARARELAERADLTLASHLADWAVQAAPDDRVAHALRAEIYTARATGSAALMTRGIFTAAAQDSAARAALPPA
jgi:alkyl sulfatase BDS1-like metallo-beta-lactamase superfamily hydrolase